MKKQIILAGILACMSIGAKAQDAKLKSQKAKLLFRYLETSTPDLEQKMTSEVLNLKGAILVMSTNWEMDFQSRV